MEIHFKVTNSMAHITAPIKYLPTTYFIGVYEEKTLREISPAAEQESERESLSWEGSWRIIFSREKKTYIEIIRKIKRPSFSLCGSRV